MAYDSMAVKISWKFLERMFKKMWNELIKTTMLLKYWLKQQNDNHNDITDDKDVDHNNNNVVHNHKDVNHSENDVDHRKNDNNHIERRRSQQRRWPQRQRKQRRQGQQ